MQRFTALLIARSIVSLGILFLRHSSSVARKTALYCGSITLPFSKQMGIILPKRVRDNYDFILNAR